MATIDITYTPYDLNNPADLSAWSPYDEFVFRDAVFGPHAGGDDALTDNSSSTYVQYRSINQDSSTAPGPSWVATCKLQPDAQVPEGAELDGSLSLITSGTVTDYDPNYDFSHVPTLHPKDDGQWVLDEDILASPFVVLTFGGIHEEEVATLHELAIVATYTYTEPDPDPDPDPEPTVPPPLRMVQRDDMWAMHGAARARGGTSLQGSIRQRGYV